MRVTERAAKLLAVITETYGVLEPVVLPFGVTNAPVAFQYVGSREFATLVQDEYLDIFIDDHALGTGVVAELGYQMEKVGCDPVVFSEEDVVRKWKYERPRRSDVTRFLDDAFQQHLKVVSEMLRTAIAAGFKYKFSKTLFAQFTIQLLGRMIGLGTMTPSHEHTKAIVDWPRPTRRLDPESYLGLLAFMRNLLPSEVVEISAPLREIQDSRLKKLGPVDKAAVDASVAIRDIAHYGTDWEGEHMIPECEVVKEYAGKPMRSGTLPWTLKREQAFRSLKRLVVDLQACYAPDVTGAMNGTNPYWLFPDASGFGIGCGIMQFAAALVKKEGADLRDYLRQLAAHFEDPQPTRSAVETLQAGLRRALMPIAFFSATLSEAELKWIIWEKELYAIVRARRAFPDLLNGAHVYAPTDHLNNTTISSATELKVPTKILRWSLELAEAMHINILFSPGSACRIGDGLSRNPKGRDQVRPAEGDDVGPAIPRTLAAIMECMRGRHRETHEGRVNYQPAKQQVMAQGKEVVPAVYVPHTMNFVELNITPEVESDELRFATSTYLDPTVCLLETESWFAETKKSRKSELKRQLQDGSLALLRLLRRTGLKAVIAVGEGCFPVIAMLVPRLRHDLYQIRRVSHEDDISELEEALAALQYVILVVPTGVPPKTRLKQLLDQTPELPRVGPARGLRVVVYVPEKDPTRADASLIADWFTNSSIVTEVRHHEFAMRPAWKTPYGRLQCSLRRTTVTMSPTRGAAMVLLTRLIKTTFASSLRGTHWATEAQLDALSPIEEMLESSPALATRTPELVGVQLIVGGLGTPEIAEGQRGPANVRWIASLDAEKHAVHEQWDGLHGVPCVGTPIKYVAQGGVLVVFHFELVTKSPAKQGAQKWKGTPFWKSADELAKAQSRHAYSREVIDHKLNRSRPKSASKPVSGKIRERALKFHLEGAVLFHTATGVPYVPPEPVADVEHPGQDWRTLMIRESHDAIHASHVRGTSLVLKVQEAGWWETMETQVRAHQDRCEICAAYLRSANVVARLRSHHANRPFRKIMYDLVEMTPPSEHGEKYVFTAICCYCKFPFFRVCKDRGAKTVAWVMYTVILEAGVCPLDVQSDCGGEVHNAVLNELVSLLGIAPWTIAPYNAQAAGMIERPHQELRSAIAIGLRKLGLRFRDWPKMLPVAEYRLRSKPLLGTQLTPFACARGYFNASPLQTVCQAVLDAPTEVILSEWVKELVENSKTVWALFDTKLEREAEAQVRYNEKAKICGEDELPFNTGDIVYWRRPRLGDKDLMEEGQAVSKKALPKADGPFAVGEVISTHNVYLHDPFTGGPVTVDKLTGRSQPVATNQLIRLGIKEDELKSLADPARGEVLPLSRGDFIVLPGKRLGLARVSEDVSEPGWVNVVTYTAFNRGLLTAMRWAPRGTSAVHTSEALAKVQMEAHGTRQGTGAETFRLTQAAALKYAQLTGSKDRAELFSFGYESESAGAAEEKAKIIDARNLRIFQEDRGKVRGKTGLREDIQRMVLAQNGAAEHLRRAVDLAKQGFRVGIGCSHGKHRSVSLVELAARELRDSGFVVEVRHLNLGGRPFA